MIERWPNSASRSEAKVRNCKLQQLRLKVLIPSYLLSPYFGADGMNVIYSLLVWTLYNQGPQKYKLCLVSALLRLSLTTPWLPILLMLGTGYTKKVKIVYVISQGNNLFLTPDYDYMNNCIQNWNKRWDPSLIKSTVWPVWPPSWSDILHVWYGVSLVQVEGVFVKVTY